jgi:hypothetical protein
MWTSSTLAATSRATPAEMAIIVLLVDDTGTLEDGVACLTRRPGRAKGAARWRLGLAAASSRGRCPSAGAGRSGGRALRRLRTGSARCNAQTVSVTVEAWHLARSGLCSRATVEDRSGPRRRPARRCDARQGGAEPGDSGRRPWKPCRAWIAAVKNLPGYGPLRHPPGRPRLRGITAYTRPPLPEQNNRSARGRGGLPQFPHPPCDGSDPHTGS